VHDPINSVQELSKYPLPCGHSPSRPRLRNPLLCYRVPQVIHLFLPRFSHIVRILEALSSLTAKASLRISLLRHPFVLCYLNTTYSGRSWITTGFSWTNSGLLHAFQLDSLHLSFLDRYFPLTCITGIQNSRDIITILNFRILFQSVAHRFSNLFVYFQICSTHNQIHKHDNFLP
jgi:hypothetical protein